VVDPLDGTKEFIAGRDEFTVNCAGDRRHANPRAWSARRLGLIWRGVVGRGAERITRDAGLPYGGAIRTRPLPAWANRGSPPLAARIGTPEPTPSSRTSRRGAAGAGLGAQVRPGSRTAQWIFIRGCPTSEWDVAAGHAVVVAAAARSPMRRGLPLRYGAGGHGFILPDFIAWGDPAAALTAGHHLASVSRNCGSGGGRHRARRRDRRRKASRLSTARTDKAAARRSSRPAAAPRR